MNFPLRRPLAFATLLTLAAACGETPSTPLAPGAAPRLSTGPSATLLECTTHATTSASKLIDIAGGTLSVTDSAGGVHEIVFPAHAVSTPTNFTLEVPASKYVEVRVTARDLAGSVQHVTFPDTTLQPTLAISYKRCTRQNTQDKALGLYHIDEATNAVEEGPFGAKESPLNPADPRVKGKVPHFSDYAVGMPD